MPGEALRRDAAQNAALLLSLAVLPVDVHAIGIAYVSDNLQ
jgi:hypothetical protein